MSYTIDWATMGLFRSVGTLWTNPNPSLSFAAQTINLSSSDYDYLAFFCKRDASASGEVLKDIISKDSTAIDIGFFLFTNNTISLRWRYFAKTSDTQISASDGADNGTTNNNRCIPTKILGLKLNR